MKYLDFKNGYINLSSTSCLEVLWDQEEFNKYTCKLHTDKKIFILFSFEDEKDAKKFCYFFWRKLKEFFDLNDSENIVLDELIRESLEKVEEEYTCKV